MSNDEPLLGQEKDHYRALLLQEQQRVAHLSLINAVQRSVLSSPEIRAFLPVVAHVLALHFTACDAAIYLCDPLPSAKSASTPTALRMVAHAGEHGLISVSGGKLENETSYPLRCAREQRTICHDFSDQLGAQCDHLGERDGIPTLEIPITQDNHCLGVLELASRDPHELDAGDVVVAQMIAAILASRIESSQIYDEVREMSAFQQTLFSTMLHSLLVVDGHGRIQSVNERFCQTFGVPKAELEDALLEDVFDAKLLARSGIFEAVRDVTENGVPHELEEVKLPLPGMHLPDGPLVFDIRIFRVFYRGTAQAVLLFINLTTRWRNFHQLQLMSEIGRFFSASLDINKVLRTVLTCITAGSALGFNRAFLLLVDEELNQLKGAMALGPSTAAEAHHIWHELSQSDWNLQQILEAAEGATGAGQPSPLQEQIDTLAIDLDNPLLPALRKSLDLQRAVLATHRDLMAPDPPEAATSAHKDQWERASALFNASEMVVAPLLAKGRLVGVVLADNVFSGNLIEEADVQLLDNLAQQAGLTIDNARTYQALQKAQKDLVNAERLAVVGDMTARLSHEIRNPLATIGGFGRRLRKFPHDAEAVERNATVIVEETERLEELLSDLLEMARADKLELKPQHLHEVVDKSLLLADADIKALGVRVETDYATDIPPVMLDRGRLLQALLNITRNGAQAMPDGGTLCVSTRLVYPTERPYVEISVSDQGPGISSNALKHVFDPFYSTKLKGSGLGLAITRRIVQDHGGDIRVESIPGQGSTFTISLPLQMDSPA